ncbi:MAG: peptidylprolyl isomerase [Akkermansiaceae bacterium]|nr:peptidylprolyl isomerase [Akkermansiaceae bacterium]
MAAPAFADPENTMVIELKDGPVTIALRPDLAPKHVEQIKTLVRQGAYNGVAFHRVIDGFMAQTGDVQHGNMDKGFDAGMAGTGGSDLPDIPAEFTDKEGFMRGTVGMARSQDPNPHSVARAILLSHYQLLRCPMPAAMYSLAFSSMLQSH